MAEIEDVIAQVSPQWRPAGPFGGYIASELKKIHDDSLSVFPESVYSVEGTRRLNRWKSTMHSDYIPIEQLRAQADRKFAVKAHMGKAGDDDCGVAGTLGGWGNTQFQRWKVPSRLTDSDARSATRASVASIAQDVQDANGGSGEKSALPQIYGASPRPCTVQSIAGIRRPAKPGKQSKQPKSLAAKTLFNQYHARDERSTTERFLAHASDSELKMMEKALNMGQPKSKDDVAAPVKKWLDGASDKEREVALTFFKSLAGTQLMGGSSDKKERMDQVVSLLENPPNKYATDVKTTRSLNDARGLRHINLLTPTARQNKWRHQTWHNLPSYPNKSKVLNKSSILIEPHGTVPRHFTIHPDWGP